MVPFVSSSLGRIFLGHSTFPSVTGFPLSLPSTPRPSSSPHFPSLQSAGVEGEALGGLLASSQPSEHIFPQLSGNGVFPFNSDGSPFLWQAGITVGADRGRDSNILLVQPLHLYMGPYPSYDGSKIWQLQRGPCLLLLCKRTKCEDTALWW